MIWFLTGDLLFQSRVVSAAKTLGQPILCGKSVENLRSRTSPEGSPTMVLIDLTTPQLDLELAMGELEPIIGLHRIVAFGPHVQIPHLQKARDLGCLVMTRGQFDREYPRILSEAGQGGGEDQPES